MDLSSEMIHSLLPVFLVSVLGTGAETLGLIEGIAEATASIAKVFSGVLERSLGPPQAAGGVRLRSGRARQAAVSAGDWRPAAVLAARFADRLGKGIRGAPRDALVADVTPPELRGAAFGLRQALDTLGAVLGPLVAIGLMALLAGNIRAVFWIAVLPAWVAVALLALGIEEPTQHADGRPPRTLPHWRDLQLFGAAFWSVVVDRRGVHTRADSARRFSCCGPTTPACPSSGRRSRSW